MAINFDIKCKINVIKLNAVKLRNLTEIWCVAS